MLQQYYANGDKELLGELLERFTLVLFGVGMKYLKSETLAQDMVQQVFLKALSEIPKYRIDNIGGWLYLVAKNYCLTQLRQKQRSYESALPEHLPQPEELDENELWQKEADIDLLHNAIKELKTEQQTSISLFYLERKSYQEISEQTGYDLKQVKSHIQNGKRNLRLLLAAQMKSKK